MASQHNYEKSGIILLYLVLAGTLLIGIDGNIWSTLGILIGFGTAILAIYSGYQPRDGTPSST